MQQNTESEKVFNCDKCGLCCDNIANALNQKGIHAGLDQAIKDFPFKLENGKCPNFKRNRCAVYENRPLLCRIDDLFTAYPDLAVDRDAWHAKQHSACNVLKQRAEDEKLVRFKKSMKYLGWDLSNAHVQIISEVFKLTSKGGSKMSLEALDSIQKNAYAAQDAANSTMTNSEMIKYLNEKEE